MTKSLSGVEEPRVSTISSSDARGHEVMLTHWVMPWAVEMLRIPKSSRTDPISTGGMVAAPVVLPRSDETSKGWRSCWALASRQQHLGNHRRAAEAGNALLRDQPHCLGDIEFWYRHPPRRSAGNAADLHTEIVN
jgi:hypothetical protein